MISVIGHTVSVAAGMIAVLGIIPVCSSMYFKQ